MLFDNLKKTIAYTLAHIPPETWPLILYMALGMPLGLQNLLVLSIDLITEQASAFCPVFCCALHVSMLCDCHFSACLILSDFANRQQV